MTIEEAKKLDHFVCAECSSDDDVKKSQNGFTASPADDVKVRFSLFSHLMYRCSITCCSKKMFYYLDNLSLYRSVCTLTMSLTSI